MSNEDKFVSNEYLNISPGVLVGNFEKNPEEVTVDCFVGVA